MQPFLSLSLLSFAGSEKEIDQDCWSRNKQGLLKFSAGVACRLNIVGMDPSSRYQVVSVDQNTVCELGLTEACPKDTFIQHGFISLELGISNSYTRRLCSRRLLKIWGYLGLFLVDIVTHFRILEANVSFPVQMSFRRPGFQAKSKQTVPDIYFLFICSSLSTISHIHDDTENGLNIHCIIMWIWSDPITCFIRVPFQSFMCFTFC